MWDEWNAKTARAQADEALEADEALMEAYEGVDDSERERLTFPMGPLSLGFDELVGLRLNEHTFHSWDIAVMLDGSVGLPEDATALVIDNLSLIARFTGRPNGEERTIAIRTTGPRRDIACASRPTAWQWGPAIPGSSLTSSFPPRPSAGWSTAGSTPTTPLPSGVTPRCSMGCAPSSLVLRTRKLPSPAPWPARGSDASGRHHASWPTRTDRRRRAERVAAPAAVGEDGACPSPI